MWQQIPFLDLAEKLDTLFAVLIMSTDQVLELYGSQFPVIKIKGDIACVSENVIVFLVQILLKVERML